MISKTARESRDTKIAFEALTILSKIIDINDPGFSREAGILHAELRKKIKDFGLADAFTLAAARKVGAKVLTGDPHFKNVKEGIMV